MPGARAARHTHQPPVTGCLHCGTLSSSPREVFADAIRSFINGGLTEKERILLDDFVYRLQRITPVVRDMALGNAIDILAAETATPREEPL